MLAQKRDAKLKKRLTIVKRADWLWIPSAR
jgi:hypothetical protein